MSGGGRSNPGQVGQATAVEARRLVLGVIHRDADRFGEGGGVHVHQHAIVAVGFYGADERLGDPFRAFPVLALGEAGLAGGHQEIVQHDRNAVRPVAPEGGGDALVSVHGVGRSLLPESCPAGGPDARKVPRRETTGFQPAFRGW